MPALTRLTRDKVSMPPHRVIICIVALFITAPLLLVARILRTMSVDIVGSAFGDTTTGKCLAQIVENRGSPTTAVLVHENGHLAIDLESAAKAVRSEA